jgi:hypothetical protein
MARRLLLLDNPRPLDDPRLEPRRAARECAMARPKKSETSTPARARTLVGPNLPDRPPEPSLGTRACRQLNGRISFSPFLVRRV